MPETTEMMLVGDLKCCCQTKHMHFGRAHYSNYQLLPPAASAAAHPSLFFFFCTISIIYNAVIANDFSAFALNKA